jgi:hypothetical protein
MKRMIRGIVLGGITAIALLAGAARANDMGHARPPVAPVSTRAPLRLARWDRDGDHLQMRREYGELSAARERFYRGWHGDRSDRDRFERWRAARSAELDRHWAHQRDRW